jgi:hypothetical protein
MTETVTKYSYDEAPADFIPEDDTSPEALEASHEENAETARAISLERQEIRQNDESESALEMFLAKIEEADSIFEVDRIMKVVRDDCRAGLLTKDQTNRIEARANAKITILNYNKRQLSGGWLPYKD